ncbi:MAG: DUF1659 domain-containing protein [Acidaminococcaceae bacterium]|nr:DUF1659 domain-containing protein [Acidaminococcaceae bacterium]
MAAVMNVVKRTLSVGIARGVDAEGKSISKSYVYSNVKPNVEPAKLVAVGKALGGLFDNEITGLTVVERAELIEE